MNSTITRSPRLLLLKQQRRRSSPHRSQRLLDSGRLVFTTMALAMTGLFAMTCLVLHGHLALLSSSSQRTHPTGATSSVTLRRSSSASTRVLHHPAAPAAVVTTASSSQLLPPRIIMTPPSDVPYDIYHCPDTPPPNYPNEWNLLDVLDHWNIDDTVVPSKQHQGLCVWDARVHASQIETYLKAEVPFVLQHHPDVVATAERWSTPGYLEQLLSPRQKQTSEHSHTNQFMFWRPLSFMTKITRAQQAPIDHVELTFAEWHAKAVALQNSDVPQSTQEHWYFRVNGVKRMNENMFLYDELPFFDVQPGQAPTWFMVEPDQERGINCRFGMKGAFAASHFDPTRNWITLLGGTRRYLLSNYTQCAQLQLYPVDHPSQRHSMVDWSHPHEYLEQHPEAQLFAQATVNEVVLQAGDALYLPTSWFHAIVSLDINYQCNARFGVTAESFPVLKECGFGN